MTKSADSTQSLLNYKWHFSQNWNKIIYNLYGNQNTKQYWEIKVELKESGSLASDYTTKLLKQDSIVLTHKQKYRSME